MNWKTGDIVVSKAGHDKGSIYVVVGRQEDGRLFVADGRRKKIEAPKVKKHKHLEKIGALKAILAEELRSKTGVFEAKKGTGNACLRKQIKACSAEIQEDKE